MALPARPYGFTCPTFCSVKFVRHGFTCPTFCSVHSGDCLYEGLNWYSFFPFLSPSSANHC